MLRVEGREWIAPTTRTTASRERGTTGTRGERRLRGSRRLSWIRCSLSSGALETDSAWPVESFETRSRSNRYSCCTEIRFTVISM